MEFVWMIVIGLIGLVSDGGVHSHQEHLYALLEYFGRRGFAPVVHAFLDGRDTPPKSAAASIRFMDGECAKHPAARIATVIGRYYAMDRDKRWERVQPAFATLVDGRAPFTAPSAMAALDAAYARGESDEFVQATAVTGPDGRAAAMDDAPAAPRSRGRTASSSW